MHDTVNYVQVALPKVYNRELVELLFVQPYVRIGDLVEAGLGTAQDRGRVSQPARSRPASCARKETAGTSSSSTSGFFDLLMSDSNEFAPFPTPAPAA